MSIVCMNILNPTLLFGLGMPELIVIVILFLLLFGAKRIPELMKSLGKGVKSFKEGINEIEKEVDSSDSDKEKKD